MLAPLGDRLRRTISGFGFHINIFPPVIVTFLEGGGGGRKKMPMIDSRTRLFSHRWIRCRSVAAVKAPAIATAGTDAAIARCRHRPRSKRIEFTRVFILTSYRVDYSR